MTSTSVVPLQCKKVPLCGWRYESVWCFLYRLWCIHQLKIMYLEFIFVMCSTWRVSGLDTFCVNVRLNTNAPVTKDGLCQKKTHENMMWRRLEHKILCSPANITEKTWLSSCCSEELAEIDFQQGGELLLQNFFFWVLLLLSGTLVKSLKCNQIYWNIK